MIVSTVLILITILCTACFLHPYIFYPLSLRLLRKRPLNLRPASGHPSATLVFCAYNEAASMPAKIENLRAIKALLPDIRFKAYVDLSTDDTAEILREQAPDLVEVHVATERTGKALGMRRLVAASTTDVMVFTDANVMVEPTSISRMLDYFTDPQIGGVCGTLIYVNSGESATSSANSTYWQLEERIKKAETGSGSTMGADGSIFATRRSYYPEVPSHLLDDFIVSMSIVFAGLRLISAPDVIAYERAAVSSGDEFRRKRRIACRAYSSHRHLSAALWRMPLKDRYKYVSHRLLRWYGAAFLLVGAVAALGWLGWVGGARVSAVSALLVASGLAILLIARGGRMASFAEILKAIWATMLGVADAWRGKRYQTWQPPQSR